MNDDNLTAKDEYYAFNWAFGRAETMANVQYHSVTHSKYKINRSLTS